MKFSRAFAVAVTASVLSACGGQGAPSIPVAGTVPQSVTQSAAHVMSVDSGKTVHYMPAFNGKAAADALLSSDASNVLASTANNLIWNGGPVQTAPKIYIVFWGSKWTTGNTVYNRLIGFFNAIGGKGWINVDTQYKGSNGALTNPTGQLAGTFIDPSTTVPAHPGDSAVQAEARKAVAHFGNKGVSANYIVAIEQGHDPSGFATQWCAYHSSASATGGTIAYTNLPYMPDGGSSCGANSVTSHPTTLDGVTIVSGHEEAEAQTDPYPSSGWTDSSGAEIGDKCAWRDLIDNPAAGGYPTQPLWDNKVGGCRQSGP